MWLRKKGKNIVRFCSANKIDNYNWGGGAGGGEKKKSKRIYRTCQIIRIINAFLESLLSESFPSLGVTVHLTSLRCPSTLRISGPAVGAAQILICCYSVFLPPVFTDIRTSAFSFVGALNDLLYIPQTQSLPSWSCGFNLQLYSLWEGFGSSSLVTLTLGF